MTDHVRRRKELMSIPDTEAIIRLIERCALSEKDKQFLTMVYAQRISESAAGDMVGYYGRTATKHMADGTLCMWLVLNRMRT